ncbi:LAFA_0F02740g1_1 [Lachancea sp. 'fantastica']|nr:LAFA_0F02740g1_1 [Lachancea sp. 'fantastica']
MANDRLTGARNKHSRTIHHGGREKVKKYTLEDIERDFLAKQDAIGKQVVRAAPEASNEPESVISEDTAMTDVFEDLEVESISHIVGEHREKDPILTTDQAMNADDMMEMDRAETATLEAPTAFVIDTNFIISHLGILEDLRALSMQYQHKIVIPRTVVQELDGLKNATDRVESSQSSSHDACTIGALARKANDWIYTHFSNLDSAVVGQRLNQKLDYSSEKDDAILDCCLYLTSKQNLFVVLMSNDKNLCLKALTEKILTVSYRKGMSAKLIAERVFHERLSKISFSGDSSMAPVRQERPNPTYSSRKPSAPQHEADCPLPAALVFKEVEAIMPSAIDHIMHVEYGDELEFTDYKRTQVDSLSACCRCIAKFWMSVFGIYFKGSGIQKEAWKSPKPFLVKIPSSSTETEHFVEFWVAALQCLYKDRSMDQKNALSLLATRWTGVC